MKTDPGQAAATLEGPEVSALVRDRDPRAIKKTVQKYLGHIYRAARGAGLDPQQAEEVTQETFTTFIEKAHRFEGRSRVRTWLLGILYRKIAEARREIARDSKLDDIDQVFESRFDASGGWSRPPRPAEAEFRDKQIRRGILGCLEAVPARQRMAFVLREVVGLSTDEIRNVLGVTRTNLGVMLHRVRNRLRECLEASGIRR